MKTALEWLISASVIDLFADLDHVMVSRHLELDDVTHFNGQVGRLEVQVPGTHEIEIRVRFGLCVSTPFTRAILHAVIVRISVTRATVVHEALPSNDTEAIDRELTGALRKRASVWPRDLLALTNRGADLVIRRTDRWVGAQRVFTDLTRRTVRIFSTSDRLHRHTHALRITGLAIRADNPITGVSCRQTLTLVTLEISVAWVRVIAAVKLALSREVTVVG